MKIPNKCPDLYIIIITICIICISMNTMVLLSDGWPEYVAHVWMTFLKSVLYAFTVAIDVNKCLEYILFFFYSKARDAFW